MFHTRRDSHASLPGLAPGQLRSFQTLKPSNGSNKASPDIEIFLVHGCCSLRAHKLEKSLWKSAAAIEKGVGHSRVHIFGFDAAKVLRKGKRVFNDLASQMLEDVKSIPERERVAVIAHSSAAWIVREALVQSQYDRDLKKVPVGLVDFGLPKDPSEGYWESKDHWNDFRDRLLKHLMKGRPKIKLQQEYPVLDFSTIDSTAQEFAGFRHSLGSPDEILPILPVCCPERKGVHRRTTGGSQWSDSSGSSTGSDDSSCTMFVSMSPEEEEEIIGFLKKVSKSDPVQIPTLMKRAMSPRTSGSENVPERRLSTRSPSRGRHSASYDTRSMRSYAGGPFAPTYEQGLVPEQFSDGAETPRLPFIESSRRTESPQPLTSAIQKPGPPKPLRSVGFKESDEQRTGYTNQLGLQKYTVPIPVSISREDLKDSKDFASWCFQHGDLDEANRLYRVLIAWCEQNDQIDRGYYKMQLQIGQISFIHGDYRSSESRLKGLLDEQYRGPLVDPGEASLASEIARWLALSQWRQGKYTDAQSTLDGCRHKLPTTKSRNSPNLLSTLALVLASAGSFKRAWKLSIKAIDPKSFEAYNPDAYRRKDMSSGHRSTCLLNHARISYVVGKLQDADEANLEALEDMKRRYGPQHFVTLDASSFQAWLLVARSKTSQATEAVHRTLREMMLRLGESHPSTLQTLETLVLVYKSEGRYSDAEETATYLLRKNKEVLGHSHPQTLKCMTILAEVFLACGKSTEAERIQREVVELEEVKPKAEINYPGLFTYKTTLANILREIGEWDEARTLSLLVLVEQLNKFGNEDDSDEAYQTESGDAEPLPKTLPETLPETEYIPLARLQNLLEKSKPILEEIHNLPSHLQSPLANSQPVKIYPSIIQTMHCLALCEQVRDDADLAFARGILKMVRDIRVTRLGEDHRATVNVQYDLAVNYRLRGKFRKSLKTIEDVVKRRRDTLGADHPDYQCAKHQQAVALFRLGRWKEALEEQRRTLKAQEFLLGKKHPDAVLSRFTLAGIYHSLSRLKEADQLLDEVISAQKARYGEDHPIVIRSRARHALICLDREDFHHAEEEQRIVVQRRKETLPKGHSLIRSARNDLAQIIQANRRPEEALIIYKDLVNSLPLRSGGSMLGFEVRSNLGSCYFDLGDYDKAKKYQQEMYEELKRAGEPNDDVGRLIASTFNLALTLRESTLAHGSGDELTKACKLLGEAVERAESVLGPDHPQTVELRATLSTWRREEEVRKIGHPHTADLRDSAVASTEG